jgi:hypothetical protein
MYVRLQDGEVAEVSGISLDRKARTKERFSMMFDKGWLELAGSALTGADYRVMCVLMSRLSWENTVPAEAADIAKALGMKTPNVSRSIQKLIEEEIFLDTGDRMCNTRILMLRSDVGWKGKLVLMHAQPSRDALLQARAKRAK